MSKILGKLTSSFWTLTETVGRGGDTGLEYMHVLLYQWICF